MYTDWWIRKLALWYKMYGMSLVGSFRIVGSCIIIINNNLDCFDSCSLFFKRFTKKTGFQIADFAGCFCYENPTKNLFKVLFVNNPYSIPTVAKWNSFDDWHIQIRGDHFEQECKAKPYPEYLSYHHHPKSLLHTNHIIFILPRSLAKAMAAWHCYVER